MDEAAVQSLVRLAHAALGPNWRNNSGVLMNEKGVPIRFGLNNETKVQNEHAKSGDIIGITPVYCYVPNVGWTTLGVFTNIECKHDGWHQTAGDKRASAQANFHAIVRKAGGYAGFATCVEDVWRIIGRGS